MGIRKKKTVRDQLEVRLDDFLNQAEDLRKQVSDRAPEVRDSLLTRIDAGLTELKARWPEIRDEVLDRVPEMSEDTYDKLPDGVKDKVPEQAKPKKKRRLRKLAVVGLVTGAGAAALAAVRRGDAPPAAAVRLRPAVPHRPQGRSRPPPRPRRHPEAADDAADEGSERRRRQEEGPAQEEVSVSAAPRCHPRASARTRSARSTRGSAPPRRR